jgi:hypothetical protein
MAKNSILKKACFDEKNGVKILHIKGTPYEMGYQHGYLLADKIDLMLKRTLLATAAYVAQQTGSDLERAEEMMRIGQKKAEPFVPMECKDEMRGIAEGANDSDLMLLWSRSCFGIQTMINGASIVIPITGGAMARPIQIQML